MPPPPVRANRYELPPPAVKVKLVWAQVSVPEKLLLSVGEGVFPSLATLTEAVLVQPLGPVTTTE